HRFEEVFRGRLAPPGRSEAAMTQEPPDSLSDGVIAVQGGGGLGVKECQEVGGRGHLPEWAWERGRKGTQVQQRVRVDCEHEVVILSWAPADQRMEDFIRPFGHHGSGKPFPFKVPSMNTPPLGLERPSNRRKVPTVVKVAYTAFVGVLLPCYWNEYGWTNFLW